MLPKYLFHGTTLNAAQSIEKTGLLHNYSKSFIEGVYLSDSVFDAANYCNMHTQDASNHCILVINTSKLHPNKLQCDPYELEDYLIDVLDYEIDYAKDFIKYASWEDSLQHTGQIAYLGSINPESIVEVATISKANDISRIQNKYGGIMSFIEDCQQDIEVYYKNHVNPFEMDNNDYVFSYYPDTSYIICADNYQDALEAFGEYCKEKELNGFISDEQENEEDFPVNGGQFWLQVPDHMQEIKDRMKFTYSVTFDRTDEESREHGDTIENGFEIKEAKGNLHEIANVAQDYGTDEMEGAGWLYTVDPPLDKDNLEKGIETNYALHVDGQGHNRQEVLKGIYEELNPQMEQENRMSP